VKCEKKTIPVDLRCNFIPVAFRNTLKGDIFLLFYSGNENSERILIFSTALNIEFLCNSKYWVGDGTFRVCPKEFFQ
jgi:hypothetical protein